VHRPEDSVAPAAALHGDQSSLAASHCLLPVATQSSPARPTAAAWASQAFRQEMTSGKGPRAKPQQLALRWVRVA
jgi:hypothetical protein